MALLFISSRTAFRGSPSRSSSSPSPLPRWSRRRGCCRKAAKRHVERTIGKYIAPFFRKMKVKDVCNAYLDTINVQLNKRKKNVYQKAGLPHIKVHGFRHSCVSYLLSQGMSYRTIARWVGDTEEVVLQTYSHLIPDEKGQIGKFPNGD